MCNGKGIEPALNVGRVLLRCGGGPCAQRYHPTGDGKQIFNSVVQLTNQQVLLLLRPSSLSDVDESANRTLKLAVAKDRAHPILHRKAASIKAIKQFIIHMRRIAALCRPIDGARLLGIVGAIWTTVVNDVMKLLSDGLLLTLESEHSQKGCIAHRCNGVRVDAINRIRGRIEYEPEVRLLFA